MELGGDFVKRYLILLATVLLALGILSRCAEVRLANTQVVSWQITPETQQESGKSVGVDSVFLLTLDGKLDEEQVRSCLQIEPAVEYQLQQQEDSVWKLTPEEELKSGKVYAFQVKDRLGQVAAVVRFSDADAAGSFLNLSRGWGEICRAQFRHRDNLQPPYPGGSRGAFSDRAGGAGKI